MSENPNNAIQPYQPTQVRKTESFAPRSLSEAFTFAEMVLASGMAPKAYAEMSGEKARAGIVVALQFGMEVGFQPMQALQCIANINGNPAVWGDGALALVQSSGLMEWIKEDDFETIKANKKAVCHVKRRGDPVVKESTFSFQDAIDAGIFTRSVWKTYPYRMCQMRARAFALRDKFPDVLKGLKIAEEVQDYTDITPEPTATAQPKPQASINVAEVQQNAAQTIDADAPIKDTSGEPAIDGKDQPLEVITNDEAREFYMAYKNTYTRAQALEFIKPLLAPGGVDTRQILKVHYDKCMEWAKTKPEPEHGDAWEG